MKFDPKTFDENIKFCPRCKGNLERKSERLLTCNLCGFDYYIDPQPTNAAILTNKKGEILLVKRKLDPKKGYWDLPGGFLDLHETIEESMDREILEEIGIKARNLKYFTSTYDTYLFNGFSSPSIASIFIGEVGDEKIIPSDDAEEAMFFAPKKIPFNKIAFPSLVLAIKKFLSKK